MQRCRDRRLTRGDEDRRSWRPRWTGRGSVYALNVSPKEKRQLAREHLEDGLAAVQDERLKDAVNALFYAAEAAVVAIAERHKIDTKRQHELKADAAVRLHEAGVLGENYGPLLRALNQARKDIWYEGEEPELNEDLENIAAEVEALVAAAQAQS
jgi:HEPN domain